MSSPTETDGAEDIDATSWRQLPLGFQPIGTFGHFIGQNSMIVQAAREAENESQIELSRLRLAEVAEFRR